MKVVTAGEMKRIDERAQEEYGLSGYELMDCAGRTVARAIEEKFRTGNLCVVCGKGNNAGDGFVIAREFAGKGRVHVVCLVPEELYSGSALQALEALRAVAPEVLNAVPLADALAQADVVVDAVLGTGVHGVIEGEFAQAVHAMNASGKPVACVDVPSGLSDFYRTEETNSEVPIVRAAVTFTIGLPKKCLLTVPGAEYAGEVKVLASNFPPALLDDESVRLNWAPWEEVRGWLPPRKPDSNKGTYGNVAIIGGAVKYAGATVLVSKAALKSGCGLATVFALPDTGMIYRVSMPEAITIELESGERDVFDSTAGDSFARLVNRESVLCMGPGLGTAARTSDFVWNVLRRWEKPMLLDADALNLMSEGMMALVQGRNDCVMTPHPGEMARLVGTTISEVQANREGLARDFALKYGVVVVLKGADTVVARPDGQAWLISGGEPALAKGGAGDVLAGVISALMAQGMEPWKAAVAGATAHLEAGRRCAARLGSRGVLARDLADEIPLVLDA